MLGDLHTSLCPTSARVEGLCASSGSTACDYVAPALREREMSRWSGRGETDAQAQQQHTAFVVTASLPCILLVLRSPVDKGSGVRETAASDGDAAGGQRAGLRFLLRLLSNLAPVRSARHVLPCFVIAFTRSIDSPARAPLGTDRAEKHERRNSTAARRPAGRRREPTSAVRSRWRGDETGGGQQLEEPKQARSLLDGCVGRCGGRHHEPSLAHAAARLPPRRTCAATGWQPCAGAAAARRAGARERERGDAFSLAFSFFSVRERARLTRHRHSKSPHPCISIPTSVPVAVCAPQITCGARRDVALPCV